MCRQWHQAGSSLVIRLVSIAYPTMDLLLLAAIVRMAVGAGKREWSFYLLLASVLCLLGTDTYYGFVLIGAYTPGAVLDVGWAAFYILWGAAALHPSMRSLEEPATETETRLTRGRLLLLGGATLMAPGIQFVQYLNHQKFDIPIVVGSSILLFLLVVARMSGLVHKQEQSAGRERALREAGAALVTATNRESIYAAALS